MPNGARILRHIFDTESISGVVTVAENSQSWFVLPQSVPEPAELGIWLGVVGILLLRTQKGTRNLAHYGGESSYEKGLAASPTRDAFRQKLLSPYR